jgi:nitrate reductase gamma subunit
MSIFLFIVFPYVAIILAVGVWLYRYWTNRYGFSSVSSQLLENTKLFWGSVPWHYGITLILLAHLLAWLFPGATGAILGHGVRLFVLEAVGLALTLFAAVGILVLIARRLATDSRARVVTSPMDWVLLFVLLVQVLTGAVVALFDRWGSHWFLSTAAPWLWSLVRLHPDASSVTALPAFIQFHFLVGFVVILLIPFTRLVHVFVPPFHYLFRPYQVVIWYRDPRRRLEPVLASAAEPARPHPPGAKATEGR